MRRVLVVDGDPNFRTVIRSVLDRHYEVLEAGDLREAFQLIVLSQPDLIVIDQVFNQICVRLRSHPSTRAIPVLVLVGFGDEPIRAGSWISRVKCLEEGADDVMDKAFYPEELVARIRARLRTRDAELAERSEVIVGNLRLDPLRLSVTVDGSSVALTPTEFDLLRYFLERPDRVVPRKQLLGDLWPDSVVSRRTIDTHIANLRRKLRGFDHGFETIYGAGYRLTSSQL